MWKEGDFLQSEDEKSFLRLKNQAYQIDDPLSLYGHSSPIKMQKRFAIPKGRIKWRILGSKIGVFTHKTFHF